MSMLCCVIRTFQLCNHTLWLCACLLVILHLCYRWSRDNCCKRKKAYQAEVAQIWIREPTFLGRRPASGTRNSLILQLLQFDQSKSEKGINELLDHHISSFAIAIERIKFAAFETIETPQGSSEQCNCSLM